MKRDLPPVPYQPIDGIEVSEATAIDWLLATNEVLPSLEQMWVATLPAELA